MKTIGLLGGMTCESSVEYYRLINEGVRRSLGGIHAARSVMVSVDFADILPLMNEGKWDEILSQLIQAARQLELAGADFLVICTNTMHKLADPISEAVSIPLLNIIDVTAEAILRKGLTRVGLLGTRFTMSEPFYRQRLESRHAIATLIPDPDDIETVNRIIMEELTLGQIKAESKAAYWDIMNKLRDSGAQGIILGCTEIPLLVKEEEGDIPLFDTTALHAEAAVKLALSPA